jgi:phosphocarrier protein
MGLMMLAASKGTSINISATGPDAQKALDALTNLINNKFGEEQ